MSEERRYKKFLYSPESLDMLNVYSIDNVMNEAMKYVNKEGLDGYELDYFYNSRDSATNYYFLDIVTKRVKNE